MATGCSSGLVNLRDCSVGVNKTCPNSVSCVQNDLAAFLSGVDSRSSMGNKMEAECGEALLFSTNNSRSRKKGC